MEKIKEKFQEKFQKWLDNFCLRGNCSSVRAGLKYFTRYHLRILLWIILGARAASFPFTSLWAAG